jgi:hypothetical protein
MESSQWRQYISRVLCRGVDAAGRKGQRRSCGQILRAEKARGSWPFLPAASELSPLFFHTCEQLQFLTKHQQGESQTWSRPLQSALLLMTSLQLKPRPVVNRGDAESVCFHSHFGGQTSSMCFTSYVHTTRLHGWPLLHELTTCTLDSLQAPSEALTLKFFEDIALISTRRSTRNRWNREFAFYYPSAIDTPAHTTSGAS